MLLEERDCNIIKHIHSYCLEIEETVLRFGSSGEIFKADKIYRNASTMCILQIGELAGKLSSEFLIAHKDVPWRSVKAMRNVAAHAYGSMNIEDTWETIMKDIPFLKRCCERLLEQPKKAPETMDEWQCEIKKFKEQKGNDSHHEDNISTEKER